MRATRALVGAYSYDPGEPGEVPATVEWLVATAADDEDGAPGASARDMASDVLPYVGLAWLVIIVTPAVLAAVESFPDGGGAGCGERTQCES